MSANALQPPFHYFGGKSKLAKWIASHIPAHENYVELFAGSAAVLFHKSPSAVEILNDLDGAVWSFFTALRDHRGELEQACRLTPYSRHEFAECVRRIDDLDAGDDVVERARRFFAIVTQGFGSVPATQGWSRPSPAAPEAQKVHVLIDRFAACADRLRRVHLECRPALDVLAHYDAADTLFYVDPPYLNEVRSWYGEPGSGSGQAFKQDYRVEMSAPDEHVELLEHLTKCEGAVLLSGKRSEMYDDMLGDWYRAESPLGAGETLWSNRPIIEHMSLF